MLLHELGRIALLENDTCHAVAVGKAAADR